MKFFNRNNQNSIPEKIRMQIIEKSCKQVSRGVFYSTIIIISSFLPVFLLTGQEGKLFHPLAYTKTFIMIIDALLVLTLGPVLISIFMKGNFKGDDKNPINRTFEKLYEPLISFCLKWKKTVLGINILALLLSIPMVFNLGKEFMPSLDEGSILFMPVTLPDISNTEAKRILKVQDKIIASIPEVAHVLGKAGRAATATDNSPISMIETIILLKPHSQWRKGMSKEDIIAEMNEKLQIPGVINGWTMPIVNRINMLATGIRTDVGVKVYGQNLDSINKLAQQIKSALQDLNGVEDMYVDPIIGGKYIDVKIIRPEIARYNLSVDDVNAVIETALGGMNLTTTVEGRQRFAVSAKYGQDFKRNLTQLKNLQIQTEKFGPIPLQSVADIELKEGPPMITSEDAMLRGTVLFNVRNRDLGSTVNEAKSRIDDLVNHLPKGYYVQWSGQYENLIRGEKTLKMIIPIVLLIIFVAMYFAFNSLREAFFSLISIPFALIGGVIMIAIWDVNLSIAVAVGFIALFGLAVETGIVMVIYLNDAMQQLVNLKGNNRESITPDDIKIYVIAGAAKRLRPKLMTVAVTLFGLVPVLWSDGVGSDVMKPIVLPMVGGVFTSAVHILLVTPIIFYLTKVYELKKYGKIEVLNSNH